MKKMRTLLTSFSLAALFTLSTACAVEPDSAEESESFDVIDAENLDEATSELPSRDKSGRSVDDIPSRGLSKLAQYCEESSDCESEICDPSIHRCRD